MKDLFIAVPNMGKIASELVRDLLLWRHKYPDLPVMFMSYQNPVVYARNLIIKEFLKTKGQYLMMIDADQTVPLSFLEMSDFEFDIISPKINIIKQFELIPMILEKKDNGEYGLIQDYSKGGIVEVDAVGSGCMMIKRAILETMPPPWFEYRFDETGDMPIGNDFLFCQKAKELGYKIWVHTGIVSSHFREIDLAILGG
mgnify:CR=1 FL=1